MKIELISKEDYNLLLEIQKNHPILTFQNKGYECIDKSKFTDDDKIAFDKVTKILRKSILGLCEFNNYCHSEHNELRLRFQYNYNADWNSKVDKGHNILFTGVGYILVDELLNGFRK